MRWSCIFLLSASLVAANPNEPRQGLPPSLSLNLPAPFPSLVLLPQVPVPQIPPQQAQVLNIVSQAAAQIGQVLNVPLLVRPAGSTPILPNGIITRPTSNLPVVQPPVPVVQTPVARPTVVQPGQQVVRRYTFGG